MVVFLCYRKNFAGTQKRVRIIQGKRTIDVWVVNVLLYLFSRGIKSESESATANEPSVVCLFEHDSTGTGLVFAHTFNRIL